ncbi:MAG: hypothetical protein COA78_30240 [Blastopirellula sp.]|nr:MAG: hypothetical protein COA78_30240 [Blastopirellula sp.]
MLYALYAILLAIFIGASQDWMWLMWPAIVLMILYFFFVSIPCLPNRKKIKKAMLNHKVEVSGSKWSFSNPIRVTIRKDTPEIIE